MEDEEIDLQQLANQMSEADEPEADPDEDQPAGESEAGDDAIETQDTETDDDTEDDQPEGESFDDSAVVKWKTAAGEEFEAPVSELKAGYMRNQDYTQKTQDLAKERDTAHQQIQQQYHQVEQYAQELGALSMQNTYIKQLEASIGQFNRHDDPVGYNAAVNELLMAQRQRDGLAAQISQIQQGRTVEQQQAFAAAQQQAAAALASGPNALPGFGKELVTKMNEAGRDYGLSDQDLATITDPRHIRILHDAMRYRELQSKKPEAVKKATAAKPARQTRSTPPSTVQKAAKSFAAKPSIEAMAAMWNAAK